MKNAILILTLIIAGCTAKKQVQEIKGVNENLSLIKIIVIEDESISFVVTNSSTDSIYIYQPKQINIEKLIDNSWVKLRILYCPCGAPCAKPPEKIGIINGGEYTMTWDKNESWCGEKNEVGIPETIKERVSNGKYRLRVLYSNSNNQKEVLYKEFELK
jgi:hypothetical protein